MIGRAYVGCSGWVYKDWRGIVYPEKLPQRRWFEHYTTLFDTVEINNSFYRLPPPEMADHWAAQAPPGFVYALKLGQFGSHRMKLKDSASWLPNHLDRTQRLGKAEGPTLVRLFPEAKIEHALDVLLEGRTAIIIAHRLQTAMRADRIAVVHDGRIVELGSHDELVAQGGRYADMFATWEAHASGERVSAVATE